MKGIIERYCEVNWHGSKLYMEIARLRNVLRANRAESPLLELSDPEHLNSLGITQKGAVTRAGLLVTGREDIIRRLITGHEVIYLHHISPTDLYYRLDQKGPLLQILEKLTDAINIRNPFKTLKTGLFHIDIPAFPESTFREAILNALIHRDYLEPGSVYLRHMEEEMSISSPGGFIGGINADNVLHAEPRARNRLLAEIFQKLGLVERAGIGRRRIFIPPLAYGKRAPMYEADDHTVKLTLFDGIFDRELASFITTCEREGKSFDIIELLLLSYLRKHGEIDVTTAAMISQLTEIQIKDRLDQIQWPALIRQYIVQHGSINNSECRELLLLGGSNSAQTTVSRMLTNLDFLEPYGSGPKNRRYRLQGK